MSARLPNVQLDVIAAIIVATFSVFRLFYKILSPKPIAGVPHNPITSIWGDVPEITKETKGKTFSEYLTNQAYKHGPIYQLLIARLNMVVVSDLKEAERIMLDGKITEQSKITNIWFATVIPTGQISLPTNETWRRHRRLTGPSMTKKYLEKMSMRVAAGASNLARLWSAKLDLIGPKGDAFDVITDLRLATMDTIVNIMIGTPPGGIDNAYNTLPSNLVSSSTGIADIPHPPSHPLYLSVRAMMASIDRVSAAVFPSLTTRLIWASPTWRKHYSFLSTFFDERIAEAKTKNEDAEKASATDADCVVDMAIRREEREGVGSFKKGEVVDELMTYIIAGQDTTAATLSWHVKFLPQDPDIQRRLYNEICAAFGQDGELEFEVIDDSGGMPVLEAVVAETLRCAKIGTLTGRELLRDEVIMGRLIPKGTPLLLPIGFMNNQESTWGSDAGQWKPGRWLNLDGSFNRTAGPSIPFGLGQRSCFGQKLAILQIKMFAAILSRAFFFREVPEEVGAFDAMESVTRQPKICYVSLEKWNQEKDRN